MARTNAGDALTAAFRQRMLELRAQLLREIQLLWPLFDPADFDTLASFLPLAETLIADRHQQAAGLAVAYYETFRMLEGVPGDARPVLAAPPPPGLIGGLLTGAAIAGVLAAARAGRSLESAGANGFARVAESSGSLVLRGSRDTILDGVRRDPTRPRWQRITSGSACAFCRMLASRGPVYVTEQTGDFQAHGHCACTVEPAFDGYQIPASVLADQQLWRESTRGLSGDEARNAFRRAIDAPAA